MNIGVASRGACFKTSDQALCLFIYFIYLHFLYRKEPAIDILRAKSLGLSLGPVHTEIASVVSVRADKGWAVKRARPSKKV